MHEVIHCKWHKHSAELSNIFSSLHLNDVFSDATVVCRQKHFSVHKIVLATCSSYFKEIFEETPCAQPLIIMDPEMLYSLEVFLNLIYKGWAVIDPVKLPELISFCKEFRLKGIDKVFTESFTSKKGFSVFSFSKRLNINPQHFTTNHSKKIRSSFGGWMVKGVEIMQIATRCCVRSKDKMRNYSEDDGVLKKQKGRISKPYKADALARRLWKLNLKDRSDAKTSPEEKQVKDLESRLRSKLHLDEVARERKRVKEESKPQGYIYNVLLVDPKQTNMDGSPEKGNLEATSQNFGSHGMLHSTLPEPQSQEILKDSVSEPHSVTPLHYPDDVPIEESEPHAAAETAEGDGIIPPMSVHDEKFETPPVTDAWKSHSELVEDFEKDMASSGDTEQSYLPSPVGNTERNNQDFHSIDVGGSVEKDRSFAANTPGFSTQTHVGGFNSLHLLPTTSKNDESHLRKMDKYEDRTIRHVEIYKSLKSRECLCCTHCSYITTSRNKFKYHMKTHNKNCESHRRSKHKSKDKMASDVPPLSKENPFKGKSSFGELKQEEPWPEKSSFGELKQEEPWPEKSSFGELEQEEPWPEKLSSQSQHRNDETSSSDCHSFLTAPNTLNPTSDQLDATQDTF